jgi:hypothetical protein
MVKVVAGTVLCGLLFVPLSAGAASDVDKAALKKATAECRAQVKGVRAIQRDIVVAAAQDGQDMRCGPRSRLSAVPYPSPNGKGPFGFRSADVRHCYVSSCGQCLRRRARLRRRLKLQLAADCTKALAVGTTKKPPTRSTPTGPLLKGREVEQGAYWRRLQS